MRPEPGTAGGGLTLPVRVLLALVVYLLFLLALYVMLVNRREFGFPEDPDSKKGQ
jgi:hypothetical protein